MEGYGLNLLDFLPAYEEIDPLYNYYDEKENNINRSIFLKKEFNELRTDNTPKERIPGKFTPLSHQSFAARFLSQYTPYDKLLAVHEVGTGKTCLSSLTVEIAKQENPFLKEALFIVKNDTLKRNVVREISTVCTNGKYLPSQEIRDPRQYTMLLNRLIATNYITYTYYEVKKEIENMTDREIDEYFSNRVIIIDEAHNLCIKSEDSVVYSHIHRMLHNIHNFKILLLTATPMRDTPKDMALILNLLLPIDMNFNDKTFMTEYFDQNKQFIPEKKDEFLNKVRGLISYVRASSSSVNRMYQGMKLDGVSSKLSVVEMIQEGVQAETYEKAYHLDVQCKNPGILENDEDKPDDEEVSCFYSNSRQASVFVAPDGTYGSGIVESGWYNQSAAESTQQKGKIDNTIKKLNELVDDQRQKLSQDISDETRKQIENLITDVQAEIENLNKQRSEKVSFKTSKRPTGEVSEKLIKYLKEEGDSKKSMLRRLQNLSIKYANIIDVLLAPSSSKDKAFIYSNMVSFTGANLLAALLRVFGFEHVKMPTDADKEQKNDEILMNSFKSKSGKPQFLLITGSSIDSRTSDFLINRVYNNPLNKYGDYIKIAIGSRIIGEGSSFKHTRQLHIVNPGWNETELEQAQGRAIRAFSHDIFPLDERYVKIYRWCAIADKDYAESIDYILYKICSDKDRPIQQVERLLKMSAVDCAINYKRNMNINQDTNKSFDSDFSRECDYEECIYQCVGVPSQWYLDGQSPELIFDSYNLYYADEKLLQIQYRIEELFRHKFMFDFYELMKGLRDIANDVIIVRSLKRIIDESVPIKNKYNITSYLREENNFYFLTDNLQYSINNKFLQAYYNANPIIKEVDSYNDLLTKFESRYFEYKLKLLQDDNLSPDEFERLVYSIGDDITSIMIERFVLAKYMGKNENARFRDKFLQLYENIKVLVTDNEKVYFKPKGKSVRIFKEMNWEDASEKEASEYTDILKAKEQTLKQDNPFGFYGIYKTTGKKKTFGFITFFKPAAKAVSTGDVNKAQQEKGKSCENPGNQFPAFYNKILLISVVLIAQITGRKISLDVIKPSTNRKKVKQLMEEIKNSQNENIDYVVKNIYKYLKINSVDDILPQVEKLYPSLLDIFEGISIMTRKDLCPVMEQWCRELGIITEVKN